MLSLAKAAKDYYLRGGAVTGVWRGSGAAELGMAGIVSAEGLGRLFDGEHPGTGERLGRRLCKDGVAAWDVTFSADKSVSLLWALGDEETRLPVLEAFDEATTAAFGYLESVASSTRGASKTPVLDDDGDPVLNDNGTPKFRVETWSILTGGLVAASFTEFTSRADDPQLHTHVVAANKVKGNDGIWRSVDGRLLYRHQLAAGYLHEAVLRGELTRRLGVRWQSVHNGMADIEGFDRHQIEAFSRRRHQAEAWREEQGLPDTAAARQVAVLATRNPKQDHPLVELEVEWRNRADQVSLTADRVVSVTSRSRQITPPDPLALFDSLGSADGLTARASTFTKAEVVKEVAAALPEGGTRGEIEALAETFLDTGDVAPVLPDRDVETSDTVKGVTVDEPGVPVESLVEGGRARPMRRRDGKLSGIVDRLYTTVELLATEQRIIEQAVAGVAAGRWVVPDRLVEPRLRHHRHLTDGQREMVRSFATSGDTVNVGMGPAGTGKTSVMAVISQLAALTGTPIVGAALAARAAAGLQMGKDRPGRIPGSAGEGQMMDGLAGLASLQSEKPCHSRRLRWQFRPGSNRRFRLERPDREVIAIGRLPGVIPFDLGIRTLRSPHRYSSLRAVFRRRGGQVRDRRPWLHGARR